MMIRFEDDFWQTLGLGLCKCTKSAMRYTYITLYIVFIHQILNKRCDTESIFYSDDFKVDSFPRKTKSNLVFTFLKEKKIYPKWRSGFKEGCPNTIVNALLIHVKRSG